MSGKQIKLFLVEGTPGGLTTAEITNWTGHVLSGRRSELGDLFKRDEAQHTGVYLLLGDDETAVGDTRCYIGEADVVADRLRHHHRDKDFWDRFVVITSKDTNLTKSHGRYLESRLIAIATEAGRVTLENGTAPPRPALPEADASDTESPVFRLRQPKARVDASAQQIDGEFTMLAGSFVVESWHGVGKADSTIKAYASHRAQHARLVADGSIETGSGVGRLTRDVVFSSPSTAGAVALGRSCNGRREWIAGSETFSDWESRGVE